MARVITRHKTVCRREHNTGDSETLAMISKIIGVELFLLWTARLNMFNLAVHSEEEKNRALNGMLEKASRQHTNHQATLKMMTPIVDWHTDIYPFVCMTMLSDCMDMVGGETALRKRNAEILKVRGPQTTSRKAGNKLILAHELSQNMLWLCKDATLSTELFRHWGN
ncbi:hypothetical protein BJX61DRAFT_248771 [Aspergillus egyptiacus]|nr:hypothetical protein BJX61DRAFT_248771 [Aspergillus egyptiacus]